MKQSELKKLYSIAKPFIDADSHMEECFDTFKYIDSSYEHRRPVIIELNDTIRHRPARDKAWLIDGELRPKLMGPNPSCYATPPTSKYGQSKPVSIEVQGLLDPDAYVKSMQTIGLDTSVLYPTLMLHPVTRDPGFEDALCRAYNSFMAEQSAQQQQYIKWAAVLPMRDPKKAVAEIKRAKALGACACMVLSTVGNVPLHDSRFDSVYEAMVAENMPLSIHVGWPLDNLNDTLTTIPASLVLHFEAGIVHGLFSVLAGGILDRFPDLKVAFIEAGIEWTFAFLSRAEKWRNTPTAEVWLAEKSPLDYLKDHQVYFTVEGDEDQLREFVDLVGVDRILGAADFPHIHYDGGQLSDAFMHLITHAELNLDEKTKILGKNSLNFYRF